MERMHSPRFIPVEGSEGSFGRQEVMDGCTGTSRVVFLMKGLSGLGKWVRDTMRISVCLLERIISKRSLEVEG